MQKFGQKVLHIEESMLIVSKTKTSYLLFSTVHKPLLYEMHFQTLEDVALKCETLVNIYTFSYKVRQNHLALLFIRL